MEIIYCVANFVAKEGYKETLARELALLIPETVSEPGCLKYELTEEISYSGSDGDSWDLSLIECWRTRDDFDSHCNSDYIRHFFNVTAKEYVEKSDVRLYLALTV